MGVKPSAPAAVLYFMHDRDRGNLRGTLPYAKPPRTIEESVLRFLMERAPVPVAAIPLEARRWASNASTWPPY